VYERDSLTRTCLQSLYVAGRFPHLPFFLSPCEFSSQDFPSDPLSTIDPIELLFFFIENYFSLCPIDFSSPCCVILGITLRLGSQLHQTSPILRCLCTHFPFVFFPFKFLPHSQPFSLGETSSFQSREGRLYFSRVSSSVQPPLPRRRRYLDVLIPPPSCLLSFPIAFPFLLLSQHRMLVTIFSLNLPFSTTYVHTTCDPSPSQVFLLSSRSCYQLYDSFPISGDIVAPVFLRFICPWHDFSGSFWT